MWVNFHLQYVRTPLYVIRTLGPVPTVYEIESCHCSNPPLTCAYVSTPSTTTTTVNVSFSLSPPNLSISHPIVITWHYQLWPWPPEQSCVCPISAWSTFLSHKVYMYTPPDYCDVSTCLCLRIKPAKETYEKQLYQNLADIVRWVDRNSAQLDLESSLSLQSARHHKTDFITALEVWGCDSVREWGSDGMMVWGWQCEDVTVWWCASVRLWQCEDDSVREWHCVMWGWVSKRLMWVGAVWVVHVCCECENERCLVGVASTQWHTLGWSPFVEYH